ncbi:MAG: BrnT family toxin [Bryobacteraceae bacterium]
MRFEWDPLKSLSNLEKHGISFATAQLAFDDPRLLSMQDRVVDGEERWQAIGMIGGTTVS